MKQTTSLHKSLLLELVYEIQLFTWYWINREHHIENHELEFIFCNELEYPPKYHAISKYSSDPMPG